MSLETFYSYAPLLGVRTWDLDFTATEVEVGYGTRGYRLGESKLCLRGAWGHHWTNTFEEAYCGVNAPNCSCSLCKTHEAPAEDCSCGIYAFKTEKAVGWQRASLFFQKPHHFSGIVAMEDVIEHEKGYRAARALIVAGLVPHAVSHWFESWPIPVYTNVPDFRVHAQYLLDNPEEIPLPRRENGSDWRTPTENQTRNAASPIPLETEASWQARTNYTRTFPQYPFGT